MFAALRRLFRKPPPPAPDGVVSATGSAGGKRLPAGHLDMETIMTQASLAAHAEGITDPDVIRKRKLTARAKLRDARDRAVRTGEPVSFKVGGAVHTVTPT
jgi:hypothetical protein